MPQQLDAVNDVVVAAVNEQTFPSYAVINLQFQHTNPNGNGRVVATICPCREDGGTVHYHRSAAKQITIEDPLDNPSTEEQAFLDAMVDMLAAHSALVNAATV